MRILFSGRPTACGMDVLEVLIITILFAGMHIACEMDVLEFLEVRTFRIFIIFRSENFVCQLAFACEMGVPKDYIVRILFTGRHIVLTLFLNS